MPGVIGKSVPRRDGAAKVSGRATFAVDVSVPGMVVGRLLRSPHPHARIGHVDTAPARAVPGVLAVLTASDVAPYERPLGRFTDQPMLARDRVRYEGEPVAAVAAVDGVAAEEALERIEVTYDPLPVSGTIQDAMRPGAPLLHEELTGAGASAPPGVRPLPGTNVLHAVAYRAGDAEGALRGAEVVLEETYRYPAVHHYALEAPVVLAAAGPDGCTVWASSRRPYVVRQEIAARFGLDASTVRVIVPYVGGAYGSKSAVKLEPLAVALALACRRPVRLAASAGDAFRTVTGHEVVVEISSGATRDGRLVARRTRVYVNVGAYADVGPVGPRIAASASLRSVGPYRIPHLDVQGAAVYTNTVPGGALRGYGAAQTAWAYECHTDHLARRLALDPVRFRLLNLLQPGERVLPDAHPMDGDAAAVLRAAAGRVPETRRRFRGRGLAVAVKDSAGNRTVAQALVRLHADGSATVLASSTEIGQGAQTILAQIAADVLSLPVARVQVALPDTTLTPFDQGTGSSGSTIVVGHAVRLAALDARRALMALAAPALGVDESAVRLRDGRAVSGRRSATYAELVQRRAQMAGGELIGRGVFREAFEGRRAVYWETGATAVQVAVDPETGVVTLLRLAGAADIGRAINPALAEGQEEGAAVMGLGPALFESIVYEAGQLLTASAVEYRVPLPEDLPQRQFDTRFVAQGDGPGPYGTKGAGESGILSIAPAVAAAVAAATGAQITELPLSPERVWQTLRRKGA